MGFNRYYNNTPAGNFQFPGLDAFPNIQLFDLGSGLQLGPDSQAPQFTIQNLYQFEDNVSWNKGAERLYGYTAEEMIGQSIQLSRMETTAQTRAETIALDELVADILSAGAGLSSREAATLLSREGPRLVKEILIDELNVTFDTSTEFPGELDLTS